MLNVPIVGHIYPEDVPDMIRNKPFKIRLPLGATPGNPAKKVAIFEALLLPTGVWRVTHKVQKVSEGELIWAMQVWPDKADVENEFVVLGGEFRYFMEFLHQMRGDLSRGGEIPLVEWFEIHESSS
jgi:hypothetical protein